MWTWLRIFLPDHKPKNTYYQGDASGLNHSYIANKQNWAILRKGGLINLAAKPRFMVFWVLCALALYHWYPLTYLLIPASISLVFALQLFRRYRVIEDTPTSRLSSGAQGYVELHGTVHLPDGEDSRGLPHLPATAWLAGYVEDEPFVVDDGKGRCLLYPEHAEVFLQPADTHLNWLRAIYPGQTLYVLGELRSYVADNVQTDRQAQITQHLLEWKRQPNLLLQHFDADGNGEIDAEEWEQVRQAATKRVDEDIVEQKAAPASHVMDNSQPGLLFLISNLPPDLLAKRYYYAIIFHNVVWLGLMLLVHLLS